MSLKLQVWRQPDTHAPGRMVEYAASNLSTDMSFLELLDHLNEELLLKGDEPIAFDSDCREGICGSCGMVIGGIPHGPLRGTTACQLFLRNFKDGQTVTVEPWRARAFPVVKDLVVDRGALDRVIAAGGYVSVDTGAAPDGNSLPIAKDVAERAMDAAQCIGCGACVAGCKNASAMLFVAAKVTQFALLPQGQPERERRVTRMVAQMDREGFGGCTNEGECEAVCPKEISTAHIARLNREHVRAVLKSL